MRNIDPTFGDLRALREQMMRWAMRMTGARHRAEDLVQSALLKMMAKRHQFTPGTNVDGWARTTLLNVFRDERRRDGKMTTVSLDSPAGFERSDWRRTPNTRNGGHDAVEFGALVAPDDPFTAVYCRQVCRFLGLDSVMLLAAPPDRMTATQRTRRFRARRELRAVA